MFGFGRSKEKSSSPTGESRVELCTQIDVLERTLQAMVYAGFPRATLLESLRRVDAAVRSEVRAEAKKLGEPLPPASKNYSRLFDGL